MRRPSTSRAGARHVVMAAGLSVVLLLTACGHPRPNREPDAAAAPQLVGSVRARTLPRPDDLEGLLALEDGRLDPVWAALLAEPAHAPGGDPRAPLALADRLAEAIAPHLHPADPLEAKVRQVSACIYGVARFDSARGEVGLATVNGPRLGFREQLAARKANCFAMSLLYVGVCRRLGIPARVSIVPYHAFVTLCDGVSRVHVETTARGELVDIRADLKRLGLRAVRIRTLGDRSLLAAIYLQAGIESTDVKRLDLLSDCVEQALAIDSTLAEAWARRGLVALLLEDDPLKAETCLSKAIGLEPNYPVTWLARGVVYADAARADEAAAMYARALELPIALPGVWEGGGWFLLERRQFPPAVRCFDRALKLEPKRARSLEGRGLALAALGEYDAAVRALRQAATREPGSRRLHKQLKRVLEARKQAARKPSGADPEKP